VDAISAKNTVYNANSETILKTFNLVYFVLSLLLVASITIVFEIAMQQIKCSVGQ